MTFAAKPFGAPLFGAEWLHIDPVAVATRSDPHSLAAKLQSVHTLRLQSFASRSVCNYFTCEMSEQTETFSRALVNNAEIFGLELSAEVLARLAQYYELLLRWNYRLHLVAPCSPEEFATRHVLESLLLARHLPQAAKVADVGSGAGLPIIPCLIARSDLTATLIESSQKKTVFLREAMNQIGIRGATIIARKFEDTPTPAVAFVTCRALDEFVGKVRELLKWSPQPSTLFLFGGKALGHELARASASFNDYLIPLSSQRFVFIVNKS